MRLPSIAVASIVAIVLFSSACRDEIRGTLTVSEALSIRSGSRVRELPPGVYPVRLEIAPGARLKLRIDRADGEAFTVTLTARAGEDASGTTRIGSAESGQPFDVVYTLTSNTYEMPLAASVSSCRAEATEMRCRTVMDVDPRTGSTESREECAPVTVMRTGSRTMSSVLATSSRMLTGSLLDPSTGRVWGRLHARMERDRSYSTESACR